MYRFIHLDDVSNLFIFSGIATVVTTRTFLFLTGYPQIGSGSGLHIAHVLFGGLLMMIALMLLFTFIPHVRFLFGTAIIGGVGFGLFIDEVGKFVTKDVNYFYEPAFVIMYVIFFSMFVVYRIVKRQGISQDEYLLNSIELLKESTRRKLSPSERQQALKYLTHCTADSILIPSLASYYAKFSPQPQNPSFKESVISRLHAIAEWKWFAKLLTLYFIFEAIILIFYAAFFFTTDGFVNTSETVILISCFVRGGLILYGAMQLHKSPSRTYSLFWYATVISITVVELFRLFDDPLYAFVWLLIDGLLLLSLNYLIKRKNQENTGVIPPDNLTSASES
jgi:hypothetical protein